MTKRNRKSEKRTRGMYHYTGKQKGKEAIKTIHKMAKKEVEKAIKISKNNAYEKLYYGFENNCHSSLLELSKEGTLEMQDVSQIMMVKF